MIKPEGHLNLRVRSVINIVGSPSNDYPVRADASFGSDTWGLGIRYDCEWSNEKYFTHGGVLNGYRTRMFGF